MTDRQQAARRRWRILVRGAVQGVGFRPFILRQAQTLGLTGWVGNSAQGLTIEAEGARPQLAALLRVISAAPPPNAAPGAIETIEIPPAGERDFTIRPSSLGGTHMAEPPPDLAPCDDCLREMFDPSDRRFRYPFIACASCGPRASIIEAIPYDRARTSMRHFPPCPACRAEYDNPADRRCHAEAIACPDCGPRLTLRDQPGGELARDDDALLAAARAVRAGRIVAMKGVGGFHLIADARDNAAIQRLRARKRRAEKPFAVMFPSAAALRESCVPSAAELALLQGQARPIVLLRRCGGPIADAVAPGNPWLGALLPYAPPHHLLMRELGFPVVATSGNLSEAPIVIDPAQARRDLAGIADLFLEHDREIIRPLEDSVMRVVHGRELMLRRGRGHAPASLPVPGMRAGILALGAHQKTAIALSEPGRAVIGAHIGDLDAAATRAAHARAVADLVGLRHARPRLVVRDLHPDHATSLAAEAMGLPVLAVQHHLAHVAACLAEHALAPPALGVAWDGTGYGPDGTIWGGEFLLVWPGGWRRVAHLRRFPLPGGDVAAREPRRSALGLLHAAFGAAALGMTWLAPIAAFTAAERDILRAQLARGLNAPLTSSAGRLFDGFAALCGLHQHNAHEGQAAAALEWAATGQDCAHGYDFPLCEAGPDEPLVIDWQPALAACLDDLRAGRGTGAIAAACHAGLAAAIAAVARRVGEAKVALSGGCFQNAHLTEATIAALRAAGLTPVWHQRIPPNDGGIALGQAAWAAWMEEQTPCAWRFPE